MACSSCKKSNKSNNGNIQRNIQNDTAVDFTILKTNRRFVKSGNRTYPIKMPLIKLKPSGGYGINVLIKGHKHRVDGNSAREVVVEIIRLYTENGIEITRENAWFNANIVWLGKISIKHGYTTVDELMAMVGQSDLFAGQEPVKLDDPTPEVWGASAWRFLGAYIAGKSFELIKFDEILAIFLKMLKDDFTGCPECAEHFESEIKPVENQLEAAEFMFKTMNDINKSNGKPTLTWEQASKIHRWENL